MAFIVRNISAGVVIIPDMGITLEIAEEYDLTQESPNDVAESLDLVARINSVEVAILDPLDNVTPLSTVDSILAVSKMGLPNFRSFGTDLNQLTDVSVSGETTNNVIKYTGSGFENQDLILNELGDVDLTGITDGFVLTYQGGSPDNWVPKLAQDLTRMNWAGEYAETDYILNDVVNDGGWLMIANKDTSDRAAPQPVGIPTYALPELPTWTEASSVDVIHSGHDYTFTAACWIQRIRVWVPQLNATTNYRFVIANITNPSIPLITVIPEPVLFVDNWTEIVINNYVVPIGTVLRVYVDALNSGTDTNVTGGWRNDGSSQSTAPGLSGVNGNNQGSVLRIDKTDLDSTDRTSELLGVISGSTILLAETANPSNFLQYEVLLDGIDSGSDVVYTTVLESSGGSIPLAAVCTIDIDIPIAQATQYVEQGTYWSLNPQDYATVSGFLRFSGVDQAGKADSAFGIDLLVQRAHVSSDWDLLSLSGTSGGSGGSGGGIGEAPQDGTPYSRQDAIWVGSTLAGLPDTTLTAPANGQILQYSAGQWINVTSSATDELIKVSANDTIAGYLNGKLVAGAGISLTENNDGGNETLTVANTSPGISDHTLLSNIGTNSHATIDTHIADGTIHFTEASISHLNITNIGTNSHATIDTHIADGTIHFTEASIDHTTITNIGTNSHATIDTHIADATIHFTEASIDHNNIANNGTNTHGQIDTHIADATIHFTEASISHLNITDIGTNTHAQIDTHIAAVNNPHTTSVTNLDDTTITGVADNDILIYDTGVWINTPSSNLPAPAGVSFYAHNGGVTQVIATTYVNQLFGTAVRTNANYSYNANGELTVTAAGWYTIEYNCTMQGTAGTRRESECKIQLNTVDVAGSFSRGYHRNPTTSGDTDVAEVHILLAANDVIRVQIHTTGGSITTTASACRLSITQG